MSNKYVNKFAKKGNTKTQNVKSAKSNEWFNKLRVDHSLSWRGFTEDSILERREPSLMHDFVKRNKRTEHVDAGGEANINIRHKITPGTVLVSYLRSLKRDTKDESAKKTNTRKPIVKPSRSTEQFNTLKPEYQESLLNITEVNLNTLDRYEKCILRNFVEKKKKSICMPSEFFHADYKFRAVVEYYGLKFTDDKDDLQIFTNYKITAGTTLVNHLKSLKQKKSRFE